MHSKEEDLVENHMKEGRTRLYREQRINIEEDSWG